MNNTHNLQAFPVSVPGHLYGDGSSEIPYATDGMTQRQFFAANAPKEIPEWFIPVLPPEPEGKWIDEDTAEAVTNKFIDDEAACYRKTKDFGVPHQVQIKGLRYINLNSDRQVAWHQNARIQTLAQWPWFWADMVLGAQEVKIDNGPQAD